MTYFSKEKPELVEDKAHWVCREVYDSGHRQCCACSEHPCKPDSEKLYAWRQA